MNASIPAPALVERGRHGKTRSIVRLRVVRTPSTSRWNVEAQRKGLLS